MKFLEAVLAKLTAVESRLASYALKESTYSFSQDYVSARVAIWNQYLGGFKGKENIQMLEVGSFEGRSALWFLENILTSRTSSITCIDCFLHRINEIRFDHNLRVSGQAGRVIKLGGRSEQTLRVLKPDHYDIVYIDGAHHASDVETDALLSWSLVKARGVVIFDDYLWKPELPPEHRPQTAIDKFLADFNSELQILHKGYQVIVRKVPVLLQDGCRMNEVAVSTLERAEVAPRVGARSS